MKLRELVETRDALRCKLEVYRQIYIFLQEFVSTDNREAKKSITLEGSDTLFVPDYVIEDIIADIDTNHVQQLEAEIKEIDERII